jgi:CBS-domain-containing membrane protein
LIFGLQAVPADLEEITTARLGAVAFALAVTLSVMIWLGVPHAPAGATTLIVALGLLRTPSQLVILMAAVVILILQGIAINRLAGIPYPLWKPAPK